MSVQILATDNIEASSATQVRVRLDKDTVDMYREDLENGADFPPIVVFAQNGSERHILADGFHRLLAYVNAGRTEIECDVHEGDIHAALEYALSANRAHGLRRTNADKVNAVKLALKDPVFSQLTQQEIADLCGVTRETVNRTSRKDTIDDAKNTGKKPQKPTNGDKRQSRPEPTQEEVERGELRQALSLIKAFPYPGNLAIGLELDKDDIADLEYASTWCAHAVMSYRSSNG